MEGYQVDALKLYLGDSIKIADGIILLQPTIGQIADYGEAKYMSMAQTLCATPSSLKVSLDDMGLDFAKVTDFQLFIMLCQSLTQESTSLLLGGLDLTQLKPYQMKDSEEIVLSNDDHTIVINETIYDILATYIRKMHNFKKQVDKPGNEITRKILIDQERKDAMRNKNQEYKSFLVPLISAVKCRQGYTLDYVKNMGIFEFMDDVSRLQVITQADAALNGMFCGMCDTSKMDKKVLDWCRDLSDEIKQSEKTFLKEGAN